MSMPELKAKNEKKPMAAIETFQKDDKDEYKFESTSSDDTMASKNKKKKVHAPKIASNPFKQGPDEEEANENTVVDSYQEKTEREQQNPDEKEDRE